MMQNKIKKKQPAKTRSAVKNSIALLFLSLMFSIPAIGQENLSLSNAIETVLKNNFFIKTVQNDNQVAINNNTLGNAGFLPSLDLVGGVSTTVNNTSQKYSDGNAVKSNNAATDNTNAGARLTWTLFDGMKMFATKSRLGLTEEASDINLKIQIENTVAQVIQTYFNVVKIQQQIRVLEETIKINDDRVKIAETRFEIGSASKLEFLQAKVDRNERYSEILSLTKNLDDSKANLNRLMGKSEFTDFMTTDSITISYHPEYNDLRKSVLNNNKELFLDAKNSEISKMLIRESQSLRFPTLDLNASYNYSQIKNDVGFSRFNQNQGYGLGLSVYWNLFNGFNTSREIKNARLGLLSSELVLADTRSKIEQNLYTAFKHYKTDQEILELESTNMESARENVTVALEAYRIGSISGLQLKEAQNSFEAAFSRLVEAKYQAKLSETELMRLNGELVK